MSNYSAGREVEYAVIRLISPLGYLCIRSAGSHSPVDVVCVGDKRVILVQVKRFTSRPGSYANDVASLRAVQAPPGTKRFLAVWQAKKGWRDWVDVNSGKQMSLADVLTTCSDSQQKTKASR